ncbi:hypothetical protein ACN4EK_03845 [Pantanalinema rosaneae CENA516]|uniref:hypothetical protein n=1 Tax=Pantanalinema rosaneae TaxID=1620701 RepID=UPI003D6DDE4B
MKVIEQTTTRLTLQHRPVPLWITGVLLAIGSVGLLVYLIGFQPVSLSFTCKRLAPTQTSCELKHATWIGRTSSQKLYNPQGATLIRRSGGRGGPTYYVAISTEMAQVSLLANPDRGYPGQQQTIQQINQFVSNPGQSTLAIHQTNRTSTNLLSLMGVTGLIGGILTVSLNPMVTCTFYKSLKKVVLERKNWFGVRSITERPLDTILAIELETKQVKKQKLYRAVLFLSSAERLPINQDYTNAHTVRVAVDRIEEFLGIKPGL